MTPPTISKSQIILKCVLSCAALLVAALCAPAVRADSTDGSTPLALQPGAPAGSYSLSGFDTINPYSGSLNFRLPLLGLGGRGGAAYTMTLPLEQKWRVNTTLTYMYVYEDGGGPPLPDPEVTYHYFPSPNWWSGIKPGYGPGVMQGRVAQFDAQVCPDSSMRASLTLTRLTFTAPDGTEYELRDKQSDGAPASVGICDTTGYNRGKIFVTFDGSAATFVSDQAITDYILMPNGGNDLFYPSGYLLMRDGTRYRIDDGVVSWLRDRNGNKMTFTYDSFKRMTLAKDSLNREVTVSYSTVSIAYDQISYKGFGGATRTIRVNYANLGDTGSLRSGFSIQTYGQLFPEVNGSLSNSYNPKIVRSVTLPNNQQYQFQYDSYGELSRVVLPTGGAFEYDYAAGVSGGAASGVIGGGFDDYSMNVYRRVVTRRGYDNGNTMSNKTTFSLQGSVSGNTSYVLIDQFKADGTTRISQQKVYHEGFATNSFTLAPTDYSPWKEGKEIQSDSIAADGSTVLLRSVRAWQQPTAGNSWPLTQAETNVAAKANNPQITQTVSTLEPAAANKVSKQTFAYDKYTNQTDVYEYNFSAGTAGALMRRMHTDYLTSSYDTLNPSATNADLSLTIHIRNLPTQASIFDAAGIERARSTTEYDNYVLDGADCQHSFHCSLLARSNISGLDSSFTTSYTKRGNPTAVTRYLLSAGAVTGSVSAYSQYDVAGNVVRVLDPRSTLSNNIAATIEYDDRFGTPNSEARSNTVPSELTGFTSFAFPTKVMNALGHTSYAQFDYYLGKPVNGEDASGVVASGSFSDSLDRPNQIKRGIGTGAENQTTFAYDDVNRIVTSSSDRDANGDNILVGKVLYDQMGRTIEARQYEGGSNFIATQTQYDALGRAFKTSNPFRPWQSESPVWATQAFDALGRVTSVTTPDNAVVNTSYSGNSVTVTDQAGKSRKSLTDALGRLTDIYEDPSGVNYQTTYVYDVLDDLVKVTQGSQQRYFMYDSLKRLLRARNPEQSTLASLNLSDPLTGNSTWSVGYQYDVAGNLTQKTDPRGVVSTYVYDVLSRNTTTDYSDTASNQDVKRFYDGATNGLGRFWYSYSGGDYSTGPNVDHTSIDSYDALGRPLVQRQLFKLNNVWGPTYQMTRTYNRAGAVKTQTYPSGHSITYNYDAAGRLADKDAQNLAFTGNLGDAVQRTYAAGLTYSPWGSLGVERFGTNTPLYHKSFYNIRGQLFDTRLSSVNDMWDWNRGRLILYYSSNHLWGQSGTDNNGNVRFAETWIPPENATLDQADVLMEDSYDYDALNRLSSVTESRMSASGGWVWQQQFKQAYSYDRYGNRTINAGQTSGTGINNKQFTVQTSTNRLLVPAGQSGSMTYDAAGNLLSDTYSSYGNRVYDAENKMTSAQDSYAGWSYYTYDADGRRTRRKINSQETWQVYGFDSELLAEYAANAAATGPQKEYGYRNGQLLVKAEAPANVALPANGAIASASSTMSSNYPASNVINGERAGANSTTGGVFNGWISASQTMPQWLQVDFGQVRSINEIDVFMVQDNYQNPSPPTQQMTNSQYGLQGFDVQYWNGSSWLTIPGGSVSGNNKVWKQFTFAAISTSKIRVLTNASPDLYSRLTEVEAWTSASANIKWLVTDHLGTPRMIVDQTGALATLKRHDYLPFGEELFAGTGGRTAGLGYAGGDGVRQQFTSKERDIETGLDYFLARSYSSVQGRFTGVDPDNYQAKLDLTDPQSWNAYSYVNNNPLARIDSNGKGFFSKLKNLFLWGVWGEEEDVRREEDKRRQILADQQQAAGGELIIENLGGDLIRVLAYRQDPATLTRTQVFFWTNRLMAIWEQGGGSRPLSEGEQVIDAATTVSPALAGDPYHPDSVTGRQTQLTKLRERMQSVGREAERLGFKRRIPPQRAPFDSHGQEVFSNGRKFITRDVDSHSGGVWKMFDREGRRLGTYDANLNRIGP